MSSDSSARRRGYSANFMYADQLSAFSSAVLENSGVQVQSKLGSVLVVPLLVGLDGAGPGANPHAIVFAELREKQAYVRHFLSGTETGGRACDAA